MTKLMEWLLFTSVFFGVWIAVITENIKFHLAKEWPAVVLFFPLICLFLFGLYAAIIVLYRVFTFNNCEDAAKELQQQIEEAKEDLQSKGIILKGKGV